MTAISVPVRVETGLINDLQRFGAADVSACFSCGVCTATCPLSENDATFPRRIIRYAQVGMRERLLSSKELWTCYSCGECSESCPMQAEPAEFMAAARRYAIASYDHTGLARTMYTSPWLGTFIALALAAFFALFMVTAHGPQEGASLNLFGFVPSELIHNIGIGVLVVVFLAGLSGILTMARRVGRSEGVTWRAGTFIALALAAFFALFMVTAHGPQEGASLNLFGFIPSELIHNIGIGVLVVVFLAGLSGILTMARRVGHSEGVTWRALLGGRAALARTWAALWHAVGVESLGQRRFRADCETSATQVPWFRRRWLIHAATMWGFLGLLAATLLDYGLELIGWKATGTPVPIWYPIRLLGTVAGIALIYGTSLLVVDRLRGANRALRHSVAADWTLLTLLWVTGVTGFGIELALYLPDAPAWGYWVFLFHVAVAMELVLLAPFMKFAHAVYRPVALFFFALRTGQGAAG